MKFYHMHEFTEMTADLNGNKVVVHLDEGEVSAEKLEEYRKDFHEYVDYGVLCIDHIDTETNTVYFYSDVV